jgi:hypothetical protein
MDVRKELDRLVDDLMSSDPRIALMACKQLVDDYVPWLEVRAVQVARRNEWNWAEIGRLLCRTRQSVRERFAKYEHGPPQRVKRTAQDMIEYRQRMRLIVEQRRRRAFEQVESEDVVAWWLVHG